MENQPESPKPSAKTIETLRDHLFKQIEILNGENPTEQDFARARGVVSIGQTLINSAKVEVDMVHALNSKQLTGFMANAPKKIEKDVTPESTTETTTSTPARSLEKKK